MLPLLQHQNRHSPGRWIPAYVEFGFTSSAISSEHNSCPVASAISSEHNSCPVPSASNPNAVRGGAPAQPRFAIYVDGMALTDSDATLGPLTFQMNALLDTLALSDENIDRTLALTSTDSLDNVIDSPAYDDRRLPAPTWMSDAATVRSLATPTVADTAAPDT